MPRLRCGGTTGRRYEHYAYIRNGVFTGASVCYREAGYGHNYEERLGAKRKGFRYFLSYEDLEANDILKLCLLCL